MLHKWTMRCRVCGCAVIGRSSARHCSAACRQRASRARQAEQRTETVQRALQQLRLLEGMLQGPLVRGYLPPLHVAIRLLLNLDAAH